METPERLPQSGRTDESAKPSPFIAVLQGLKARQEAAISAGHPHNFYAMPNKSSQLQAMAYQDSMGLDLLPLLKADASAEQPVIGFLCIAFPGGAIWSYAGVPRHKVLGLMAAPSHGKYFGSEIKNHPAYTASKISGPEKKSKASKKPEAPAAE